MEKRYVEHDLPLAEISHFSAIEKNNRFGHPSTLHIWWARKPLTASRELLLASLLDLPTNEKKRNQIDNLLKSVVQWDSIYNNKNKLKTIQKLIKSTWKSPPRVLDPFAGGGSIPLEALKLGCDVYCGDYNPVAVFIQKATVEWPHKFGILIEDPDEDNLTTLKKRDVTLIYYLVKKWSNIILNECENEIKRFYPEEEDDSIPVGYLWARTIECQNPLCKKTIPLISTLWLAKYYDKRKNESMALHIKVKNNDKLLYNIKKGKDIDFDPSIGTISKGNAKCPFCGQISKSDYINQSALNGLLHEQLIAVISNDPKKPGKQYRLANKNDILAYEKAKEFLEKKITEWGWIENPLPNEKIATPDGTTVSNTTDSFFVHLQCVNFNMNKYEDLFNDRQKLSLITFIDKMKNYYNDIKNDCINVKLSTDVDRLELSKAVMGYLAIMVDRMADYNSTFCLLNTTGGRGVVHTFGRTALPMIIWTYCETNIFNPYGASWIMAIERTLMVLEKISFKSNGNIHVKKESATSLDYPDNFFDVIFTDPPYYDNVPYSDLADYFYVWLKRSVGDIFPALFTTPLSPRYNECIQNDSLTRRYSDKSGLNNIIKNKKYFENTLTQSFMELYRTLKPNGIAIIVYAHKTLDGWEVMLNSLINAGFVVTASWPIHTEMKERIRAQSSAAIASSIYMVCRKKNRENIGFYSDIKSDIKKVVESRLNQFWNENIIGGDFFISAIGPGMEIFSKYTGVETYTGKKVSTYELLEYIRSICSNYVINQLLKNGSSYNIDNESQFYLTYRWTYMDNRVEYDDARKLANSMGVYLEDLTSRTGFVNKKGKYIEVLNPKRRYDIKTPKTLIDVVHKCLMLWDKGESDAIKELLKKTGYGMSEVFWRYCQAISESLLPGNKEKQLLEGFLIGRNRYSDYTSTRNSKSKIDFYLKRE